MTGWARGGMAAVCLFWLSCAATVEAPRPDPPPTAPPPACEVCAEGHGTCGCGPRPPVAPPRRCSDGSEEHVDVECLASAGVCRWRVTSTGCPEPCSPEACGPLDDVEALCPNHATPQQHPLCQRGADGQCHWALDEGSCTRACDAARPCPADQYCRTAVGDCDGPGVCVSTPEKCVRTSTVCGCFGNEYGGACAAAKAGESVDYNGRCQTVVDVPMKRAPLCRDEAQCGPPPPTAPPQRCDDGQESRAELRCERRDGGCFWGADEPTCPPPVAKTKLKTTTTAP